MATKIGIVYAAGSKLPMLIRVPDHDDELSDPSLVKPGQALLTIDRNQRHDIHSVRQYIADHHKMDVADIPSGHCALVDKDSGIVSAIIIADPALYDHPTHQTVASDVAKCGWKYDGRIFLARYVVVTPPRRNPDEPPVSEKPVTVEDVIWLDPDAAAPPKDKIIMERADAGIGDTVMAPVLADAPSEGTVPL